MDNAIATVRKMCAYTNHTILSEALEKWHSDIIVAIVPQIMDIIKELDKRVKAEYTDKSLHIIDENSMVHMARMDIHYGFSVNGVASLHTKILKETELNNFYQIYPEKFNNKTNGISFRRWLDASNPRLDEFIVSLIGDKFKQDYTRLKDLEKFSNDKDVLEKLLEIKAENKVLLCRYIKEKQSRNINPDSVFDVQIKRLHEYKRQQMNALYIINKYLDVKRGILPKRPITAIFGAKAAPAYTIAKDIIHLILCLEDIISHDDHASEYINIFVAENYNVSWAEKIIPAADISEQISLASKEASGTGNMKLMLNGALTLGTHDGANIEINSLVGDDNIYIFGLRAEEVDEMWKRGYNSSEYYNHSEAVRRTVKRLGIGFNGREFTDFVNYLLMMHGISDPYMCLADFESYCMAHNKIERDYQDKAKWNKKSLINIGSAGFFAADRSVTEYCDNIWHTKPVRTK